MILGGESLIQDLVPLFQAGLDFGHQCGGVAFNGNTVNFISLLDAVYHLLVFLADHLAEDGMFLIQPIGGHMGNKELAAVGTWPGVGHGENAGFVVLQFGYEFIFELIPRPPGAAPIRAAALDHEVVDNAVEGKIIVITPLRQVDKVAYCYRYFVAKKR